MMPAEDMKESMFGHQKFPYLSLVSIPVPLAQNGGDTYVDLIFPWEPSHFVGFVMR